MTEKIRLLIVDDEERFLRTLGDRLSMRGFEVTTATNGEDALEAAGRHEYDVAVVDLKMPGLDGEQVLDRLKQISPLTEVVILTGHGSIDSAVRLTKKGSYRYLQKPAETNALIEVLREAFEARVRRKLDVDQARLEKLMQIAEGESPLGIMRRLKEIEEEHARGGKR